MANYGKGPRDASLSRKLDTRWPEAEYARLEHAARSCGVSLGLFVRQCTTAVLDELDAVRDSGASAPSPVAQSTAPVARVPGELVHALAASRAAVNRVGVNINQLAHGFNREGYCGLDSEQEQLLRETRAAVEQTSALVRQMQQHLSPAATVSL